MDVRRGLQKRIALLEFILARYEDEDSPAIRDALEDVEQQLLALRTDLAACTKLAAAAAKQTIEAEPAGRDGGAPLTADPKLL
ncbi:MAG: hypothetical protein AMJ69_02650 [Gammaproteobacteria bacterium SG8_47]|nr:MAG: hypothetical protein AMJ69_02650 [Gammaproteobacteria bacterium SG8_47]